MQLSLPCLNYLLKVKFIADQLAMATKPVDDDGLILYILGGLGLDHGPFVTSITTLDALLGCWIFMGLVKKFESVADRSSKYR